MKKKGQIYEVSFFFFFFFFEKEKWGPLWLYYTPGQGAGRR